MLVAFARWFFVGVIGVVAAFLLAISPLTVGMSIPFAAGFGWVAWQLGRNGLEREPRAHPWLPVALGIPAGMLAMLIVIGEPLGSAGWQRLCPPPPLDAT